jgi:hypothetical protein
MSTTLPQFHDAAQRQFMVGQVYRERRPEAVAKIEAAIRAAYRGKNKGRVSIPRRLYLRVLAIMDGHIVVISTEDPRARPEFYLLEQGMNFVASGGWTETDVEPLAVLRIPDSKLTPTQVRRMETNTKLIQPLIDLDEGALLKKARWPVVRAIATNANVEPAVVFRVFIRYLQGGMTTRALAGRWYRRLKAIGIGARVFRANELGLPRNPAGRPRLDGKKPFVVGDLDVKKIIKGSRDFYFAGATAGKRRSAWRLTVGWLFLDLDCSAGVPSAKDLAKFPPGSYPSYSQFCYWSELDDEFEMLLRKLYGERKFELWLRRRREKTAAKVGGSGAVFLVDATPLDWHLVHQVTRLPLKKDARLYLVVDAFSHMIVGFYLHLGSESYDGVSLALLAASEDKPTLCRRFGMTVTREQWPCACLPTRLAEDGAGANYKHGVLVKNKVIRGLSIVPAYRPDLKGLVEAYNSAITHKAKSVPGHTNGTRERGETDPAAMACLDYFETCRLIISWILQTNARIVADYPLTNEMIADGLVPSRINLWNWGAPNLAGRRKTWPRESLLRWCLPTDKARLTRDGVQYGEMFYEPLPGTLPKFNDWCARAAASESSWSVDVSYHPASYSCFYLHDADELVPMQLAPRSSRYASWCVADYEGHKETTAVARAEYQSRNEISDIARECEQHQIVLGGMAKTVAAQGSVAKRRRDKSDRAASLEDQKHLIASGGEAKTNTRQEATVSQLQAEDEAEIAELMGDSS